MKEGKKGIKRYTMCRQFLYLFIVIFVFRTGLGVIEIVKVLGTPKEEIEVIDTGYSYRFDGVLGYCQFTYADRQEGGTLNDPKAFCVIFLVSVLLMIDTPYLVLLYYIRKILRRAENGYSPFVSDMVKDVNCVGGLLIGVGLCSQSIVALGVAIISQSGNFNLSGELMYEWIFAGILVLLFRDIFCTRLYVATRCG